MKKTTFLFIFLVLILFTSCAENKQVITYLPIQETTDTYDLDGNEMMVIKNIKMSPKKFINTATNDTVSILHHLDETGFHFYNAVAFSDEKKGVIVGGAGLRIRTTKDGGLHWQENKFSKFANTFYSVAVKDDTIFTVGNSKNIYRSTNFGKQWEAFNTDVLLNKHLNTKETKIIKKYYPRYYKIKFYKHTGIIVGDYEKTKKAKPILLKTSDAGKTWQILKPTGLLAFETGISDVAVVSEKVLYIVTLKGNCYKSIDGGNTWDLRYKNIQAPLNTIQFINENEGFIAGMNSTLIYTDDGGKKWISIPLQLSKHLNLTNIQFLNNKEAVFTVASQNGGLKADLLYQVDIKTKTIKSIFDKKDTTVLLKAEPYGLFFLNNKLYVLDRNNLYKMRP
ncbi:WD40/YVTN/BNR-like repeat-containing protein [Lutibacter sp.]